MNVVDSSAWLAYLAGEENAEYFTKAIEDADLLVVPVICIYEVFRVMMRERGETDALHATDAMRVGAIVDLDADLAMEAAAVGVEERLSFADSVIYTVAKMHNAILWTQDDHFSGKPYVRFRAKSIAR